MAYKVSDFRIQPGEKKPVNGRRNPVKGTSGKGTKSAHWAAYVKAQSRQNPAL